MYMLNRRLENWSTITKNNQKMEQINKLLEQKAVRITPMRQLLLEHFVAENTVLGLSELEKVFPKSDSNTLTSIRISNVKSVNRLLVLIVN